MRTSCRQWGSGHLMLLKWARLNGCPWDTNTYAFGLDDGDPALMQYLEDHGCPRPMHE